jgi:hypothetical protein
VEIIDLSAGHELSADQDDYLDPSSDLVAVYREQPAEPLHLHERVSALPWFGR